MLLILAPLIAQQAAVQFVEIPPSRSGIAWRHDNAKSAARLLHRRGHLVSESSDRLLDRQRIPGMGREKTPCYHILPSIFTDEL